MVSTKEVNGRIKMSRIGKLKQFCDELIKHESERLRIHTTCFECLPEEFEYFQESVKALSLLLESAEGWISKATGVVALFKGAESIGVRGIQLMEEISNFDQRTIEDE